MGFKKEGTGFRDQSHFTNEMARFVGDEAAFFSTGNNESAAGNVDDKAEMVVRLSAEKNRSARLDVKSERKALGNDIKEQKEFIKSEKSEIAGLAEELDDHRAALEAKVKSFSSSNPSKAEKEAFQKEVREEKAQMKEQQRFLEDKAERVTEKEVSLSKTQDKKKELKKKENKERKKQSTKISVAGMLRAKKDVSNELAGGGANTGDAFADGKSGLVGTLLEMVNPMHYLKAFLAKIGAIIAPYLLLFTALIMVVVIVVVIIFDVLSPIAEVGNAISEFISIFTDDNTFVNTTLTQEEIDQIVEDAECDETQEKVLRFALSKVGYPYSQDYRTSGNYYDCSSLAYYAWEDAGEDISYGTNYPPTAAEGARTLESKGKALSTTDISSLQPGDLIYYGGSANGRYKGIHHVAIYVGNGKTVEALNTKYGVVYQNVRTKDAIMVCRPNKG